MLHCVPPCCLSLKYELVPSSGGGDQQVSQSVTIYHKLSLYITIFHSLSQSEPAAWPVLWWPGGAPACVLLLPWQPGISGCGQPTPPPAPPLMRSGIMVLAWLLTIKYWLLAFGYWLLAIGYCKHGLFVDTFLCVLPESEERKYLNLHIFLFFSLIFIRLNPPFKLRNNIWLGYPQRSSGYGTNTHTDNTHIAIYRLSRLSENILK